MKNQEHDKSYSETHTNLEPDLRFLEVILKEQSESSILHFRVHIERDNLLSSEHYPCLLLLLS